MTIHVIKEYTLREGGEWRPFGQVRTLTKQGEEFITVESDPVFDTDKNYRRNLASGNLYIYGMEVHALRFTDGKEWDAINGMRSPLKKGEAEGPVGERYLKVFYCYGCQTCWEVTEDDKLIKHPHIIAQEDVTPLIGELVKTSKELATIVIANKIVIDDIMSNINGGKNGQG